MAIKIFTPVWGHKHIDLLDKALGMSLRWPKNNEVIEDAEWMITTSSEKELEHIKDIIKTITPNATVSGMIYKELLDPRIDSGMVLIEPLKLTIKKCLNDKEPILMATPDFIYGNGTVKAFQEIGKDDGSCVAIAHMRVHPQILEKITQPLLKDYVAIHETPSHIPTNQELIYQGLEHAHISWRGSKANQNLSNTYHSGIKWWDLGKTKAVQHFMPSPFFVNFKAQDLGHFSAFHEGRPPGFGLWDHVWPTELIQEGRLRYIGSSNIALMLEVTDATANVPPWNESHHPEVFFRNHFHNKIHKQFISSFEAL